MSWPTLAQPGVLAETARPHEANPTGDEVIPAVGYPDRGGSILRGLLTVSAVAAVLISFVLLLQPRSGAVSLPAALPGVAPAPVKGRPAPDFSLPLLDGSQLTLSDLRGKTVMLNFWATWCPPCRTEMPDLEAVWRERQKEGLVIVGWTWVKDRAPSARS